LKLAVFPENVRRYRACYGSGLPIEYLDGERGPAMHGDMRGAELLLHTDARALVDYALYVKGRQEEWARTGRCSECGRVFPDDDAEPPPAGYIPQDYDIGEIEVRCIVNGSTGAAVYAFAFRCVECCRRRA
jgi:hypothetical protein